MKVGLVEFGIGERIAAWVVVVRIGFVGKIAVKVAKLSGVVGAMSVELVKRGVNVSRKTHIENISFK